MLAIDTLGLDCRSFMAIRTLRIIGRGTSRLSHVTSGLTVTIIALLFMFFRADRGLHDLSNVKNIGFSPYRALLSFSGIN